MKINGTMDMMEILIDVLTFKSMSTQNAQQEEEILAIKTVCLTRCTPGQDLNVVDSLRVIVCTVQELNMIQIRIHVVMILILMSKVSLLVEVVVTAEAMRLILTGSAVAVQMS